MLGDLCGVLVSANVDQGRARKAAAEVSAYENRIVILEVLLRAIVAR